MVLLAWMAMSSGLDVVVVRGTIETSLENLCVAVVREIAGSKEATEAAEHAAAAVEDGVLAACNSEPIPNWHLVSYLHPYQQIP